MHLIVTALPRWHLQDPDLPPHLSSHHFPLRLFLQALGAPRFSFAVSPHPHSYASLPLLPCYAHLLSMGQPRAEVSPETYLWGGFLLRSALSKVRLAQGLGVAGESLQAGARGECLVPDRGSPLAGKGLQQQQLPCQHHFVGLRLQCKPPGEQSQRLVSGKSMRREKERVSWPAKTSKAYSPAWCPHQGPQPWPQAFAPKQPLRVSCFVPPKLSPFPVVPQNS